MLKIRALNRESSSDEEVPVIRREAQEEIVLELYNKALRLQNNNKYCESEEILINLLNDNIPQLESYGPLPVSLSSIKYCCYLNIGNVNFKLGNTFKALENFLKASEYDSNDVTLWYKIGKLAIKMNRFNQAAYAFSKGLECNENHWPCLDEIISLLFAMKDTMNCLTFIGKALIIDPNYTKALVFRKEIYKHNPFAKEVYQEHNPDHIWEPPIDVEIDKDDEKQYLEGVQPLKDYIKQIQLSLDSNSLQTIPLPKPLENFTWVSLGETLIILHRYLSENDMSHFTLIDLSKCMSQKEAEKCEENVLKIEVNSNDSEEVVIKEKQEVIIQEEMNIDDEPSIVERRQSQFSENNDGQENTPSQTDNDEEQPMEQDGDDNDDNCDNKTDKNRSINRSMKRKRDLLSDLQIWGWHSKRKSSKKGKPDRDFCVEDAFNRIIPNNLLQSKITEENINQNQLDDSMNTMDIYNMYVENRRVNILSPIHSPESINKEEYFNTSKEKDDVIRLWTKERKYYDVIILLKDFVFSLAYLWNIKWPNELILIYLDAYEMFREHYDVPQILNGNILLNEVRDDALATLLYGELINFCDKKDTTHNMHVSYLAFLQFLSSWKNEWKDDFHIYAIRFWWLRGHIFRKESANDLAILSFQWVQELIIEQNDVTKFILNIPNCVRCGWISKEIIAKILKHLDMINSLSCIEELYNNKKYKDVADILKQTFKNNGNYPTSGRMGRPAQLAMLLHCLWYTNLTDCFIWCEETIYETVQHFLKPSRDSDKWEKVLEKCLLMLYEIIKIETVTVVDNLNAEKRTRLVDTLCKIICKQINSENGSKIPLGCVTPWILLHYILVRDEHRKQAIKKISHIKGEKNDCIGDGIEDDQNEELPASVEILFSAHQFLGPKGWCLTNHGELLHFMLDTILDRLDTPIFEYIRSKIEIHIEQALFCLYQHPSKRNKISRHLADHNVDPLSLTWERAFQLYEFYGPESLPEFNSYKNVSISSDTEQLLQRIIALVPTECNPEPLVQQITDYINGKIIELPEPIKFPFKVRALYYLIGDYYFKQREFNRCLKYFLMDLCINPQRIDSWACLGLSYLSQIENKLNYCKKLKSEMELLDLAKCVQICFQKSLDLNDSHIMLWIEFGSFQYMIHSYCSRILKSESDSLSMEKFKYLENQKNTYLENSGESFLKAIESYHHSDESDADERWLQYYILGKVAEKKQKEPIEYLQHYLTASKLLYENNATYPEKINYHNPQHLAVEALELHYRINASILKYLELHEGKDISNSIGNLFKKVLDKTIFPKKNSINTSKITNGNQNKMDIINISLDEKLKKEEIRQDIKKCLDDIITNVDLLTKETNTKDSPPEDIIILSDSDEESTPVTILNSVSSLVLPQIDKTKLSQYPHELLNKLITENVTEQVEYIDTGIENEKKKEESETESNIRTSIEDSSSSTSSSTSSSESDSDSEEDSTSTSSTSSSAETFNESMSVSEILNLVDRCIANLEQCILRYPLNYKALYRLAHIYFNYKARKDLNKCRQLLLGEYICKTGSTITGLFSDRKNHNFFHGIWRIPSSEIDRPGSLSAHMSRCIMLLLQILRNTNDTKTLLDLHIQFKRIPDPDKIYIKDSERVQFVEQAMIMCIQSFRSQIKNIPNMNELALQRLSTDIFKAYQRVEKHATYKESVFSSMLIEVYKKFKKDTIPENANVLDLAMKFCQQNRLTEKQKTPVQNQTSVVRNPGVQNPPVLPVPQSVGTVNQSSPLKRPGVGRPRGRPPLPKIPGQWKNSRNKLSSTTSGTSTNPFMWQKQLFDQNIAYNYLKHYQEELFKQYSQNLTLTNLGQFGQYINPNQLTQNQNQAVNQYLLNQNSIINPLLNQMNQINQSTMDNLNLKTTSSFKPNIDLTKTKSPEILKSSKKNIPHTITSSIVQPIQTTKISTSNQFMNLPKSPPIINFSSNIPNKLSNVSSKTIKSSTIKNKPIQYNKNNPTKYNCPNNSKIKTVQSTNIKIFKEPQLSTNNHHKLADNAATIIMKDRPSISITPVINNNLSISSYTTQTLPNAPQSASQPPLSLQLTNNEKTLQEKLADKQKQLAKHLSRNIEAEIITKDLPSIKLSTNNLLKPPVIRIPLDSGISISQVKPKVNGNKKTILNRNLPVIKQKITNINLPISLTITSKVNRKDLSYDDDDDDVIIIE